MNRAERDTAGHPASASPQTVVIGGGFTGLAAAYELAKRGLRPTLIEADSELGGLAGTFPVGNTRVERFYHHWFTNDQHLAELVAELGMNDSLLVRPGRTGMYFANSLFRLASPLDLLRFKPLSLIGRIRLGMLLPAARSVRRWQDLDDRSAASWLRETCGEEVYRVVWEPLLRGKFGEHAETVSAAWFWAKLRLRGASRGSTGREQLVYFKGGFAALADEIVRRIEQAGGRVVTDNAAKNLLVSQGRITGVASEARTLPAEAVILATPLPQAAELLSDVAPNSYADRLRQIRHLSNRCLVLELDRSLSDIYWLNINDPSFPFVGIIEHTNFADPAAYGGRHIVYLSRYCSAADPFLRMSNQEALAFALPYLKRMFPTFDDSMILAAHSWQSDYAQPLVEVGYTKLIPDHRTPISGVYLATMAQVYPEDRGTNYAIRDGRKVAGLLADDLVTARAI